MAVLGLMLGRGAAGVPAPVPLDFAALVPPPSPNWWAALPQGEALPGARWETHALPPATPDAAWRAVQAAAGAMPRCYRLGEWPERRQAQWVVRSRLANFPDIVTAELGPAGLRLHSRSLLGWSDLGANRARVQAWLAAIDAALRAPC